MIAWLESKIGEIIMWAWGWLVELSYWFILLSGMLAYILYFATKNPKYKNYVITGIIIYIFIQGANSL